MKRSTLCAPALLLALSACASPPLAPPPACPRLPPAPAWIVQPEPSLLPVLDRIISPSAPD